jgi:DNA-directed RNA polymerase subunit N (RpoN/RPB10)
MKKIRINLSKQNTSEKCNHCGNIINNKYKEEYLKEIDKELISFFKDKEKRKKELDDISIAYYEIKNKIRKWKMGLYTFLYRINMNKKV